MDIKAARFSKLVRTQKLLEPNEVSHMTPVPELLDSGLELLSTSELEIRVVQAYVHYEFVDLTESTRISLWITFLNKADKSILFKLQTEVKEHDILWLHAVFELHYEDKYNPNEIIGIVFDMYRCCVTMLHIEICNYVGKLFGEILYDKLGEYIMQTNVLEQFSTIFNGRYGNLRDTLDQEVLKQLALYNVNVLHKKMANISINKLIPIMQKLKTLIPIFAPELRVQIKIIIQEFYL